MIDNSVEKLIQLIEGNYPDIGASRWGMEEYYHFQENYLMPLTGTEKIKVFRMTYQRLGLNNLKQDIQQLLYLDSVYTVKLYKEYMNILRDEVVDVKQQAFLEEACDYIETSWSQKAKESLTDDDRELLKILCKKYNRTYPLG